MIELQVINKILQDKSLSIARQNGIDEDHFISYKEEFEFILDHHQRYGVVPDKETFISEFRDFDFLRINESEKYLVETLKEQFLYSKMVPFVHKVADLVKVDANDAVDFVKKQMSVIERLAEKYKAGYDIIKNADDRREEFKRRLAIEGLLGIETGIEELDNILHGWMEEDLVTIVGRTNEGKSWVLLFFLTIAWLAGKRVLLYSGEMGHKIVGFRFDTLNGHFNHSALTGGHDKLGKGEDQKTPDDYYKYLNDLSKDSEVPFIVVTPKDLGGKRLTIPVLHGLIEQYKPDIIGIDQLSLMEDHRSKKGDQERLKYTHIAEDLYLTSEKFGKPILAPAQASREAEKDSKANNEKTPELHQIAESDGVPQNSTRVLAIKQIGMTMKITVRKNRYGPKNQEVLLIWDIENGIVKPFLHVRTDDKGKATEVKKPPALSGEELF